MTRSAGGGSLLTHLYLENWRNFVQVAKVAVPQLQELELWRDPDRGTPHLRSKYEHGRPQGAWQTEEQFSDGMLRLLGAVVGCVGWQWPIAARRAGALPASRRGALHPADVRAHSSPGCPTDHRLNPLGRPVAL